MTPSEVPSVALAEKKTGDFPDAREPAGLIPGHAAEKTGINLWSEYGLHAQLKLWAARRGSDPDRADECSMCTDGSRFEVPVLGKVVDLVLPDGSIVEIQTSKFGSILGKVTFLAGAGHVVRIIYPLVASASVIRLDPVSGEVVSRRKSPKKRDFWSIFDEMIHAPSLAAAPRVILEILSVEVEDLRMRDGRGSWRRKGDSLLDRRLVSVLSSRVMAGPADWLALLPEGDGPWTSGNLAESLGIPSGTARRILYTYVKAGFLVETGKEGRFKLYRRA